MVVAVTLVEVVIVIHSGLVEVVLTILVLIKIIHPVSD